MSSVVDLKWELWSSTALDLLDNQYKVVGWLVIIWILLSYTMHSTIYEVRIGGGYLPLCSSLWVALLGSSCQFSVLVTEHEELFDRPKRRDQLSDLCCGLDLSTVPDSSSEKDIETSNIQKGQFTRFFPPHCAVIGVKKNAHLVRPVRASGKASGSDVNREIQEPRRRSNRSPPVVHLGHDAKEQRRSTGQASG